MSITSFLHAIKRRPSVIAPIVAQGWVVGLLFTDRPFAAALVACFGIAWLAVLLALAEDRTNRIRADLEAELAEATTDPVTGLPVRRLAERHIADAVGVALTVAVADVDDMHAINNGHDHQFGDAYLAGIAERLDKLADDGDMVARLGGDEFVVVTTRAPLALAHALAAAMRQPITVNGTEIPVQVSVGICRLVGGDAHLGLGCADLAMFTAKRRRSGIEHYDPDRDGQPQPPDGVRRRPCFHRIPHVGRPDMGADMMVRTLYLIADTTINLAAAKTAASQLCQQATLDDLRTLLLEHGWIGDDTLPEADGRGDADLAARAGGLRQLAEQELHELLDRFARSLHTRDVYRHRFDHSDTPGVDAYTTGGPSYGDGPTDAFDDWDVVFDDDRFPDRWAAQLGAAAGLLHPWGDGPAVATVTFHAWN